MCVSLTRTTLGETLSQVRGISYIITASAAKEVVADDGRRHIAFFFSSRRRHTRSLCDWSSDVCSSDLLRRQLHLKQASVVGEFTGLLEMKLPPQGINVDLKVRMIPAKGKARGEERRFHVEIGRASCRERV